ncbi:UDP-N-acetylmuramate--L-alanine ligase [Desulfoferula mesophila]|uniref:UDP-N-acetylmuramate:L-alanyl-gamma-D-glutamyl-meso-diaminopimelate ligase n=1 Tax=Desulfoferula mesophila TaxID=3058419 RepID=A0AAU9F1W8_9BACT|nr:UDP-N-acetylmuramate:L-alanyl-gamma-D-glutamyl-meso-diaminopimelate ligase [Desulfoferula mesophilus]
MKLDPALNQAPPHPKSVYLMGIGGVAMGALAGGLAAQGLEVRGSDRPLYPPMSTFLAQRGIPVASGYDPANLDPVPEVVIVGNVIRADNPEVERLAALGLPYLSLPQALAQWFIRDRLSLVAAGTHGKTTTTALLASALLRAGLDPGFMVGGLMNEGGQNFRDGAGPHFAVEGDEYDTAFFDKRPKFVHYRPKVAILSSLEFDHGDIYADLDAVRAAFDLLVERIPAEGTLVAWGESGDVMARAARAACRVQTYGVGPGWDWSLLGTEPAPGGGAALRLKGPNGWELNFTSPLAGEHNALNVAAAVAALSAGGLEPAVAAGLMAGFGGVQRRQQVRGAADGVVVVDDFAHHPTAVRETTKAVARFGLPGWTPGQGRLVAVFEPRTNTSKTSRFQADYAQAFDAADLVLLREPPGVEDLPPEQRFSSARLADELAARGVTARAYADSDALLAALVEALVPGDLCLVMSNGGFDNLHQRLLTALEGREQA